MEFEQKPVICQLIVQHNGQQVRNLYAREKFLRENQNAKQYEVKELTTGDRSLAKIYSKSDISKNKLRQKLMAEIRNHRKLSHPHVLAFKHVFEDEENVYILVEEAANGTLEELLGRRCRLSEPEVQFYFNSLVDVLVEMNSKSIVHRDIRLETLYLDSRMMLKLGDFGESCLYKNQRRKSLLKLTHFTSPEIINQWGHGFETDLWSVGVVIYTLLTGEQPFKSGESFSLGRIRNANFSFPQSLSLDPKWKEILKRILVVDSSTRLTLEQLLEMKFSEAPHYLPEGLLNTANRLKVPTKPRFSSFQKIYQSNFGGVNSIEVKKQLDVEARVTRVLETSSEIGLVYAVVGGSLCVRFPDGSTFASVEKGFEYYSPTGEMTCFSEDAAKKNKVFSKKLTIFKHYRDQIAQYCPDTCPVIVKQYFTKDDYLLLKLSTGRWQVFTIKQGSAENILIDPLTQDCYLGENRQPIDPKSPLYSFVQKYRSKGIFPFE